MTTTNEKVALPVDTGTVQEIDIRKPQPPFRVKLDPPVELDGKKYDSVTVDLDRLVGADFQRIEREFSQLYDMTGDNMPIPEMKPLYHMLVAAAASDTPVGVFRTMQARFWLPIRDRVLKTFGNSPEEVGQ